MSIINFELLEYKQEILREQFNSSVPYPHAVIDGFLNHDAFRTIVDTIPPPVSGQKSSDYIFAKNKYENPRFDEADQVLMTLREELSGERFATFLTSLYDRPVFIDKNFVGGGLHQGGAGSFLDMHADFSRHPVERTWVREFNVLLYLNDPYEERWGGHLEMVNSQTNSAARVAPVGNRLVVMLTKGHTLHGYKPISFPEGRFRTSIAAYAYSIDSDFERTPERTTVWHPHQGGALKRSLAKAMPTLVKIKRSLMGSSTAKRAARDKK